MAASDAERAAPATLAAAAAALGLADAGAERGGEEGDVAWGSNFSPVTQGAEEWEGLGLTAAPGHPGAPVAAAAAGSAEDTFEGTDSEEEALTAAAVRAEARRLPGPLPLARRREEGPPGLQERAVAEGPHSAAAPPAWVVRALRSRDVAASVFRMLDERTHEQLSVLNCQTRDALLVAACVDPQYWADPNAQRAATAVVAAGVVTAARSRAPSPPPGQALPVSGAGAAAGAEAGPRNSAYLGATARRWTISLRGHPI